jgi:predicted nucleic acid-binding protein
VDSYRALVAQVDGPDPDDNVHMAAAVAGRAEALVTWNEKDFSCGFMQKQTIRIVNPDEYLRGLYEEPMWLKPLNERASATLPC